MSKFVVPGLEEAIKILEQSSPADTALERKEVYENESNRDRFLKEQIEDIKHYRELRKKYAFRVFGFMCVWSGVVILILLATGFDLWQFDLSNSVLVTLAGGTTASVIGLVGFITKGLFNSKNNNSIQ